MSLLNFWVSGFSPPLPEVEGREKETLRPWRKDATQCWLCTDRPTHTTQPSPPSPLQASLSTLLPTHPHSQERDNNPPSASVGLCLSYPWSDRISEKSCWSPIKKKKPRSPAQPSLPHFQQQEKSCVFICFVFYEGNSCHVWTRRPVGCCKTRHAEVLKSDTSVDSSSSRRRRLVCRDCGREGRQTVCDHQRCWLPKFDVFDAPQTQKIKP